MLDLVEVLEVRLILGVGLEYRRSLHALDAVLLEIRQHIREEQRIHALILIVRPYADEQQIEVFHLLGL